MWEIRVIQQLRRQKFAILGQGLPGVYPRAPKKLDIHEFLPGLKKNNISSRWANLQFFVNMNRGFRGTLSVSITQSSNMS